MKFLKLFVWKLSYGIYYRFRYLRTFAVRRQLHILNSEKTIRYIVEKHCSVSRFGDGEFQMIDHYTSNGTEENFHVDSFQRYDPQLAFRLLEICNVSASDHLVCIPYGFKDSSIHKGYQRIFFEREWLLRKKYIVGEIFSNRLLGDTNFTRFYYGRRDIRDYDTYVRLLKGIWHKRKLLIVEGEKSRLGVGNDLFDNAIEIRRILCPVTNAFAKYDQILLAVKDISTDYLVLIALGHTATVLAYDLSRCGYQAIDIGHIDIEYEWMRMKAKRKVPVPNKYVNESDAGRITTALNDSVYISQTIKIIK